MLQQYVSALPAAAALFQPLPAELSQLLPALLENTNRILAAASQVRNRGAISRDSMACSLQLKMDWGTIDMYSDV